MDLTQSYVQTFSHTKVCVCVCVCYVCVKRKLTFLRALCDLDNLVVRTCFSVSQEFRDLSSGFNCIIDVFSVLELKNVILVHLVRSFRVL